MSDLKKCPICSATADSDGPRKSAKCADDTCPAGRQWVCWEMWQRLPRVSSDAQEVARETPTIQCATCHGDLVWAVNATRDRYIVTACEQCAAAGETPPEITITLGEGGHDLPRAYARADLVPDDPDISIFGGVPVIGVAAAGETQGSVYLQLHDHMWGKDCGVKAVHLTSNFEGVHAGPVPVHGAPKPKLEKKLESEQRELIHRQVQAHNALETLSEYRKGAMKINPRTYVVHHKDHPPCLLHNEDEARETADERGSDYRMTMYVDFGHSATPPPDAPQETREERLARHGFDAARPKEGCADALGFPRRDAPQETRADKRRDADPWCDLQHCLDRALITGNHQDHVGWLVQAIRLVNDALDGKEQGR